MIGRLIEADFVKDDRVLTCVAIVTRVGADAEGVFTFPSDDSAFYVIVIIGSLNDCF